MASGITYQGGYIVNGLIDRRLYNCPSPMFFLRNVVRFLQENQTRMLLSQAQLDHHDNLPIITNERFHIGPGRDFNALSCNLIYSDKDSFKQLENSIKLDCSLLVTIENGHNVANVYDVAASYKSAFAEILKIFFTFGKPELRWDPITESFIDCEIAGAEVTGGALVNTTNLVGITRPYGFLPSLNVSITYKPATNALPLPEVTP